jgi:hypothetical protein
MMSTNTLDRPVGVTETTDQPDQAAHIVHVPADGSNETPQSYILRARVEGFAVTALCGHTWIPERDPQPLPVCEPCLAVCRHDPKGHGDRGDLPDA